jgi:alkyl hydroperoxide reductase subunit AhpF
MSNFTIIQCPHCHARLVPNKKVLSLIGGLGGMAAALTVGLASIVFYFLERNYGFEIIIASIVLVIMIYLATVIITRNVVDFKIKNFSHEKD